MNSVNSFGEVAVLVFALKNKDNQLWTYQENNSKYPMKSGSYSGLEAFSTISTAIVATEEEKKAILKQMYDQMIYHIPAIAILQDKVIRYDKEGEHFEDITNQKWEMLQLEGLKSYE